MPLRNLRLRSQVSMAEVKKHGDESPKHCAGFLAATPGNGRTPTRALLRAWTEEKPHAGRPDGLHEERLLCIGMGRSGLHDGSAQSWPGRRCGLPPQNA